MSYVNIQTQDILIVTVLLWRVKKYGKHIPLYSSVTMESSGESSKSLERHAAAVSNQNKNAVEGPCWVYSLTLRRELC